MCTFNTRIRYSCAQRHANPHATGAPMRGAGHLEAQSLSTSMQHKPITLIHSPLSIDIGFQDTCLPILL